MPVQKPCGVCVLGGVFRACLKNHSRHLHAPFCVIFAPNSGYIARYAPLIWHKSPTNCDAHLTESIFQTRPSYISELRVCMRYSDGVMPVYRLNCRMKCRSVS